MTGERGVSGYTDRVRNAVYEHVFSSPRSEVGGVLVGIRLGEGHAVLNGSVRADTAQGDLTSLTFTHESWSGIHKAIERDFPGSDIVGWYHSHPGHGIFLSGHDRFIHQNFFSDPACLALVVDPLNGREGLFGWENGQIVGFWERETSRPGITDNGERGPAKAGSERKYDRPPISTHRLDRDYRSAYAIPVLIGLACGILSALALRVLAGG